MYKLIARDSFNYGAGQNLSKMKILCQCIEGDGQAWEAFVEKFSHLVYSTIFRNFDRYSFPPSQEDVEDLHNSLFLSLMENDFKKLRQFRGKSSLASYIRVITSNQVLDFLRAQKKHISIDDDFAVPLVDGGDPPDRALAHSEQLEQVRSAIEGLKPSEQLLLKLVYDKWLEPREAASVMGISIEAFYNKKSRVLKKLKKILEKSEADSSIKMR